jgi:hypothetical protein
MRQYPSNQLNSTIKFSSTAVVCIQGRSITLPRFFNSDQKQIEKILPVPILAQNWAKFAILK